MSGDGEQCAESGAACAGQPVVRQYVPSLQGVQVVRLGEGEDEGTPRYVLDEAALRRVLMQHDAQDLPVVVVSVAGAFRGGKSFILDFFLRYLNAPRTGQLSGEWLGREDEPLKGFHWRAGGERDTSGIHLWPEPIIATLNNGEKVAVLLMDTQGTFDSESTIEENSTIFALSTLISSVHVYNLSTNIKEDDLQHLQLFTEYGKLAYEGDGKAFQTLLFLVRDWRYPEEHAYSFAGGDELLIKRLQYDRNKKKELQEVREHIRSCFDSIKCFLMPHPGFAIEKKSFTGCLRDLRPEFGAALLELVPSLLDPEHLTPKLINGERVRTQDLFEYFRKYIDIFNSDEVPQATTIFKATTEACLLAAARAASAEYTARMNERVTGEKSLSKRALENAHAFARAEAERVYAQKKKLGSKQDAKAKLEELIKELDASLSLYVLNNDALVRESLSLARKTYDDVVSSVCGQHAQLCLHPGDLAELHAEALNDALTLFDSTRVVADDEEDDQRTELVQSLEQQYNQLCVVNEQNNNKAVLEARDLFVTRMKLPSGGSSNGLQPKKQQAREDALAFLAKQRNRASKLENDPYEQKLLEEIRSCLPELEKAYNKNQEIAMQAAEHTYHEYIKTESGPPNCCFHPQELLHLQERAVRVAVESLRDNGGDDNSKEALIKNLESQYSDLIENNKFKNEKSVDQALSLYTKNMDDYVHSKMVPAGLQCSKLNAYNEGFLNQHEQAKKLAIDDFRSRRRGDACHTKDAYIDDLNQKINAQRDKQKEAVQKNCRK